MIMVYGDGYGDVAQRELATDAARDSRYFNSLAANRAAQSQRLAESQAQAGNELAWRNILQNAAVHAQDRDFQQQQYNQSNQLARADLLRRTNRDTAELDLTRRRDAFDMSPERLAEGDYKEAMDALSRGDLPPNANFNSLFPNLGSNRLARLAAVAGERNSVIAGEDREAASTANAINSALGDNEEKRIQAAVTAAQGAIPARSLMERFTPFGRSARDVETDKAWAAVDYRGLPEAGIEPTMTAPPLAKDERNKIIFGAVKNNRILSRLNIGEDGDVSPVLRSQPALPPTAAVPLPQPAFGGFREGQIIYRQGQPFRVVNGQPVPIQVTP